MGIRIPQLNPDTLDFPNVYTALDDPPGLLAFGGDLSSERLLTAYKKGIFPWFEEFLDNGEPSPILWWCPQPRCVLYTNEIKVSRSLEKRTRNGGFQLSCNQDFESVIQQCSGKRSSSEGTWINPKMIAAYIDLHKLGHAHSVECWLNGELVGGLYGVSVGQMFFGESMFSREKDSSKIALRYLCKLLKYNQIELLDCQIQNPHLASMGAREISLESFITSLEAYTLKEALALPPDFIEASSICQLA